MIIHKGLDQNRWFTFSLFEQLANVGTDVDRAIYWKQGAHTEYSQKSFERALELLSLTIIDPKHKGSSLKELTRLREVLIDYFVYDNEYGSTNELWHQYFFAFNYAAALQRKR